MAAFASIIGGAGQAAGQYGEQMRSLLERRRGEFADVIGNAANLESDPGTRASFLQHQADLLSGKPIGKITQAFVQTMQKRQQDTDALHKAHAALGGTLPGSAPPPQPGSAPGVVPGNQVPQLDFMGAAAQPAGNPLDFKSQIATPEPAPPSSTPGAANFAATPPQIPSMAAAGPQASPGLQPPPSAAAPPGLPDLMNLSVPQPEDDIAIMNRYMEDPRWQAPGNREMMRAAMTQELQHNAALKQNLDQQRAERAYAASAYHRLKEDGIFTKYPWLEPQVAAAAGGIKGVSIPATILRPQARPGIIASKDIADEDRIDMNGNMIDKNQVPFIRQGFNFLDPDHQVFYTPTTGPVQTVSTPGGLENVPRIPGAEFPTGALPESAASPRTFMNGQGESFFANPFGAVGAPVAGSTPPSFIAPRGVGTDLSGHPLFESFNQMKSGAAPARGAGVQPAFIPGTHQVAVQTMDENANPQTTFLPQPTPVKGGGGGATPSPAPGLTPPPGAGGAGGRALPAPPQAANGQSFQKPFTPEQQLKNHEQFNQYNLAIDRMDYVKAHAHLLDSLIESKKLQLELEPGGLLKAVFNRNVPFNEEEAKFAAAFQTLSEDINLLRGPLGATGFRGPEAFAALQNQRGNLMAHPDITRNVLENSLKAMHAQRLPIAAAIKEKVWVKNKKTGQVGQLPATNFKSDLYDFAPDPRKEQ